MWTYFATLLIALVSALALTPLVRDWAVSRSLVDQPGGRKRHEMPVPRLGGVAIALSFGLPLFAIAFLDNMVSQALYANPARMLALGGGGALALAVGVMDDLHDLGAGVKLSAQVALAAFAWFCGYEIGIVANPLGSNLELGWLSLPVTVLWIVGIMNAINLIDGLDGLASGVALFSVTTLFVLALAIGNIVIGVTSIALAGALLGFLRYNFNPASIFMGDGGSLFIGHTLALASIWGSTKSSTVVALLIPLLALGLPITDTTFAFGRRLLAGRSPFSADRGHLHHRLLDSGLGHRQAVLALYAACFVFMVASLALVFANSQQSAIILGMLGIGIIVASQALGVLQWAELEGTVRYGLRRQTRLRAHLGLLREAGEALQQAQTHAEAIESLRLLVDERCVDGVKLRMTVVGGREGIRHHHFTHGEVAPTGPQVLRCFELDWSMGDLEVSGELTFAWSVEDRQLRLPEEVGYGWVALLFRDQVLRIEETQGSVLRLAERPID